jgi:chemotaxis protein methyltransferase CheR
MPIQIGPIEFDYIRKLVHQRAGLMLDESKRYLVETRLVSLASREGITSTGELIATLREQSSGPLYHKVIEALTTHETSFFRDALPFEGLAKHVLPPLVAARSTVRRLNIWSAACASGQEPYSIALVLREQFLELADWNIRLLATDISGEMIARARAGQYNEVEVSRGLSRPLLEKYFFRRGGHWEIREEIRRMVEFREMNLAERWSSLPSMDIIFMRNVLIYFDVETKKAILDQVRRVLCPDGRLFLGAGETTLTLDTAFERVSLGRTECYRLRGK